MPLPARRETTLADLFDRMTGWPLLRPLRWPLTDVRLLENEDLPAVDMFKENGNIVVKAAMPGAKAEEIEASVHNNILTIKREYSEEKEETKKDYYFKEQRSGSFLRQLQLPETVDESKVEAELKDGMLTIKLAAAGPAPGEKKIAIKG